MKTRHIIAASIISALLVANILRNNGKPSKVQEWTFFGTPDEYRAECEKYGYAVVSEIKEVVEKPKIVTRYTATIEFTEVKLKEHLLIGAGGLGYTIIGDIKEREVEV